ncbi:hypothetical protein [Streptomyces sp. NBRC 109706]|uniref:hypothetical protein n=1 Tax=Streptomyces sp. NBRC 109706 TaxID=1550035 RepID=UPI001F25F7DD|nr:hypothetical protein [Streptomyces sp. NBRC 109706]
MREGKGAMSVVGLILAAEVGFWVVLGAGLTVRYGLRAPRVGGALLCAVPLIDLTLLVATAVDLRRGAEMGTGHGLAVLYLGFTVAYGHYVIRWADGHAAHRFGGGPRPAKPPRHGRARVGHEWRLLRLTLLAVLISLVVAQLMVWYVDRPGTTEGMAEVRLRALGMLLVHGLFAAGYSVRAGLPPASGKAPPRGVGAGE